jgi:thioredoxin reductase
VESVVNEKTHFTVNTARGEVFRTQNVIIAIGRRGSPRKLGVPGEMSEKVAYRLLEPELVSGKRIMVVGGGDSAIESALLLADQNQVTLSYRSDSFARAKPKNRENIAEAISRGSVDVRFNTNPVSIEDEYVLLSTPDGDVKVPNDQVYIFAGGELPTDFLKNAGIEINKRFGYTVKSYRK